MSGRPDSISPNGQASDRRPARTVLALAGWLAVSFAAAGFGSLFMPGEWYARLEKPPWNPPSWVFGPVWSFLYASMGVAAWLVWRRGGFARQWAPLTLFVGQLLLNAIWTPLFFGLQNPALAFWDIVLLWFAIVATMAAFFRVHNVSGLLFVPYLAWVTFAAALTFWIWRSNL